MRSGTSFRRAGVRLLALLTVGVLLSTACTEPPSPVDTSPPTITFVKPCKLFTYEVEDPRDPQYGKETLLVGPKSTNLALYGEPERDSMLRRNVVGQDELWKLLVEDDVGLSKLRVRADYKDPDTRQAVSMEVYRAHLAGQKTVTLPDVTVIPKKLLNKSQDRLKDQDIVVRFELSDLAGRTAVRSVAMRLDRIAPAFSRWPLPAPDIHLVPSSFSPVIAVWSQSKKLRRVNISYGSRHAVDKTHLPPEGLVFVVPPERVTVVPGEWFHTSVISYSAENLAGNTVAGQSEKRIHAQVSPWRWSIGDKLVYIWMVGSKPWIKKSNPLDYVTATTERQSLGKERGIEFFIEGSKITKITNLDTNRPLTLGAPSPLAGEYVMLPPLRFEGHFPGLAWASQQSDFRLALGIGPISGDVAETCKDVGDGGFTTQEMTVPTFSGSGWFGGAIEWTGTNGDDCIVGGVMHLR